MIVSKDGIRFVREMKVLVIAAIVLALTMAYANWAWSASVTCFSPYEKCEETWISFLNSAQYEIKISCFGISNKKITEKLIEKSKAGVKVLILEDNRMSKGEHDTGKILKSVGIQVIVKKTTPLEHNKMALIDEKYAIIGSWNLSENADKQDNSLVVSSDKWVVESTKAAFERIYGRDL